MKKEEVVRLWTAMSMGLVAEELEEQRYRFNQAVRPYGFRINWQNEITDVVYDLISRNAGSVRIKRYDLRDGIIYTMSRSGNELLDLTAMTNEEVEGFSQAFGQGKGD